jgi:hypothetical protein
MSIVAERSLSVFCREFVSPVSGVRDHLIRPRCFELSTSNTDAVLSPTGVRPSILRLNVQTSSTPTF